ncbi:hypothetical protein [Nostoc sp.]|uniref:hypothetical protein n=1 Tax=Nostoc sp. TaxID=1180 RepID=UPI002FF9EF46
MNISLIGCGGRCNYVYDWVRLSIPHREGLPVYFFLPKAQLDMEASKLLPKLIL